MMQNHLLRHTWNLPLKREKNQHINEIPSRLTQSNRSFQRSIKKATHGTKPDGLSPSISLFGRSIGISIFLVFAIIIAMAIIGAMIVLALIPIYLPNRAVNGNGTFNFLQSATFTVTLNESYSVGDLTDTQSSELLAFLKSSVSSTTLENSDISINSAQIVESSAKHLLERAGNNKKALILSLIYKARFRTLLATIAKEIQNLIENNPEIFKGKVGFIILSTSTTTITTIPSNLLSSTVVAGRRRRLISKLVTLPSSVTYQD